MTVDHFSKHKARAGLAALLLGASLFAIGAAAQTPAPAPAPAPSAPAAAPAQAASPASAASRVVARIDGLEITEAEIALAGEDLGERIAQIPAPQRREYLIGYLADLKIGARAAERAGVMNAPDFALRMAYFRQKVLMDEFISNQSKAAASPEAARKLYDDTMKTMKPEEEVRARHILVEKEEEAKAALARIRKGEDFAKVAAELSKDPGSGKEGGDLGYFTQDRMVPQFGKAAFEAKVGDVTEPVQTQFGWHVIKVEDKRARPLPKFEDVKGEIETYLVRKAQQDVVLSLRGDAKLERLDQPRP
jgi:peptidyl-prolyl cis-trans isomerase C